MNDIEQSNSSVSEHNPSFVYMLNGNCYINLTNLCTLRCQFCPKFNKHWDVKGYNLHLEKEPSVKDIIEGIGDTSKYKEIVFCGLGEPTMKLSKLLQVSKILKKKNARIRLNTDGLGNLVNGMDITQKLADNIDAISISLNAQNETVYNKHCRPPQTGTYTALLDFIGAISKKMNDVTLTVIDGLADVNISECERMARHYGVKFNRRVLDKVG